VRPKTHSNASSTFPSNLWIRTLAAPYLKGYRAVRETRGALRGYRFIVPGAPPTRARRGFFVGHLIDPAGHQFLRPQPPECIVFAFIEPVSSASYRKLVTAEGSLLRRTAEYIGWLTHRPPRFALYESRDTVLLRHFSMRGWPPEKYRHYSGNFFIETLAWLVRSGLVRKLLSESGEKGCKAKSRQRTDAGSPVVPNDPARAGRGARRMRNDPKLHRNFRNTY
jgi:hypothetical protein